MRQQQPIIVRTEAIWRFCIAMLLGAALACPLARAQSDFPVKPIRLVLPVPPAGGADFIARALAEKLSAELGQPIVIDNKAGASGQIAAEHVARSAADGYTLLQCFVVTHGTNPAISKLPYDPIADFAPIGFIAASPNVLVVNEKVKARTLQEFVALAKAKPKAMSFASTGIGSATHLTMEYLEQQAAIDMVHVPYKGAGPALADLMGGQVDAMFPSLLGAIPHIRSGRLRALAITSSRRSPLLPDVPTVAESGYPTFNALQWYGLCAPAKTPRPVVERLNKALNAALTNPDLKGRLQEQAADVTLMSPEEFGEFMRNEVAKWIKLVKDANLQIEK